MITFFALAFFALVLMAALFVIGNSASYYHQRVKTVLQNGIDDAARAEHYRSVELRDRRAML